MKILIMGLGSIGKRHAQILKEMSGHEIFALRTFQGQEKNDLGIHELRSWDEVDKHNFSAALITNPTFMHLETALECAKRNMHLFIEKPIDCKTDRLDELTELVRQKNLTAYIAYPLRFHPVICELKKKLQGQTILHSRVVSASYMPHWRSKQKRKATYSSFSEQGGGVILDCSHEIDYIEYLFGEIKEIQGIFGRQSSVTVNAEDFCDLNLSHLQGTTSLHMNLFSFETQRYIEVDTKEFYIKGDLNRFEIRIKDHMRESVLHFSTDYEAMFRSQLSYFFEHVGNPDIQNNLATAGKLFRKVIEFKNGKEYSSNHLR